jgi:BirA family biotin operon repressor/biotin-[acetyl-CoA-carboxylase] ligase
MFSIVLKSPVLMAEDHFALNEIAALSVSEFLSTYGIKAQIKWPNDIYVDEKKICGILIENSFRGKSISSSIIGIGLNINQRNFNVNLPNPTSMVLCRAEDGPLDIHRCLEEFMDIFTSWHDRTLTSTCDLSPLRQRYLSSLWRLGEPSSFIDYTFLPGGHLDGPMNIRTEKAPDTRIFSSDQAGNEFLGIIRGLSPTGNLLVEDLSTGLTREFGFKEIGYIL